jgi:hypothetical protein
VNPSLLFLELGSGGLVTRPGPGCWALANQAAPGLPSCITEGWQLRSGRWQLHVMHVGPPGGKVFELGAGAGCTSGPSATPTCHTWLLHACRGPPKLESSWQLAPGAHAAQRPSLFLLTTPTLSTRTHSSLKLSQMRQTAPLPAPRVAGMSFQTPRGLEDGAFAETQAQPRGAGKRHPHQAPHPRRRWTPEHKRTVANWLLCMGSFVAWCVAPGALGSHGPTWSRQPGPQPQPGQSPQQAQGGRCGAHTPLMEALPLSLEVYG